MTHFIGKEISLNRFFEKIKDTKNITEQIVRTDKYGNSFFYYLKDETRNAFSSLDTLTILEGIFDLCKE
jgi:hypothetical protein